MPPHFHETWSIGVVTDGVDLTETRHGRWRIEPGTLIVFAPGQVHGCAAETSQGVSFAMIYPSAELLTELRVIDSGGGAPVVPLVEDRQLAGRFVGLHRRLMNGEATTALQDHLVSLLRRLNASMVRRSARPDTVRAADIEVADRTVHTFRARFADRIGLSALAAESRVSPFQLIRVFRRVVGMTPYAYLLQLRVIRAQEMLRRGATVADAWFACGFSDQSHLTRTFKRSLAVAPGQYLRATAHHGARRTGRPDPPLG